MHPALEPQLRSLGAPPTDYTPFSLLFSLLHPYVPSWLLHCYVWVCCCYVLILDDYLTLALYALRPFVLAAYSYIYINIYIYYTCLYVFNIEQGTHCWTTTRIDCKLCSLSLSRHDTIDYTTRTPNYRAWRTLHALDYFFFLLAYFWVHFVRLLFWKN